LAGSGEEHNGRSEECNTKQPQNRGNFCNLSFVERRQTKDANFK